VNAPRRHEGEHRSAQHEGRPVSLPGRAQGEHPNAQCEGRPAPLLEVKGLNSYYGDSHILFDVSLRVERNEVVALLGRNGAGKSTTLKSLMGVITPRTGSVRLDGVEIAGMKSHAIARAGMQLVHEDRRIFGSLSVEENLILAGLTAPGRWPLGRIYQMFPRLKERRASRGTDLSGGEQQMLAIARALIRDPTIILLDEPFEGLAPAIVRHLMIACRELVATGHTLVLVEQNVAATLALAHRVYMINNGHNIHEGTAEEIRARPEVLRRHLGV
jgi:branched-chain amino acid transport system ATP-binding protein